MRPDLRRAFGRLMCRLGIHNNLVVFRRFQADRALLESRCQRCDESRWLSHDSNTGETRAIPSSDFLKLPVVNPPQLQQQPLQARAAQWDPSATTNARLERLEDQVTTLKAATETLLDMTGTAARHKVAAIEALQRKRGHTEAGV